MDYFTVCMSEIEKRAVSAASTLKLLQGRAAQGARVAPGIMAHAAQQAASGVAHTTPALRNVALEAGAAAKSQRAAQSLAPVKAPLQARIAKSEAMGHGQFNYNKPLTQHDAMGNTHQYSQQAMHTIAASPATISDPKGLIAARTAPAASATQATRKGTPAAKAATNPDANIVPSARNPLMRQQAAIAPTMLATRMM